MPLEEFSPKGSTQASKPDAGKANLREVPVFATVKDNVDPIRSGRLQVYIDDLGGDNSDDSSSWVTVNYMPSYFGYTSAQGADTNNGDFVANPQSYGMWFSPPDIGTKVICIFVNGDPNYGFYIGSVPQPETLRMVPAIGANFENEKVVFNESEALSYGGATRLPVTNMNTNNEGEVNSLEFLTSPKPVHSYSASIMNQQGVIRDPIRGPISSSSQRESPSRVGWGVSTPGRPIYEGGFTDETVADAAGQDNQQSGLKIIGRRGGHSIVMDDGDLIGNDQLIRLRTALGHQILLSDNGQTLSILHANGQSFVELGKEGTIDLFSTNSVNIRTQGDLNLHADNDININASKKLNIFADQINVESVKDYNQKIGTSSSLYTMGKHTHKVDGAMSMAAGGDASYASSAKTFINGERINLNTGETGTTPEKVTSLKQFAQTDTLYDKEKGFMAAPGKLLTIASRAPAHYPWANAGQGVNVETSMDADEALPEDANSAVDAANENAGPVEAGDAVSPQGIATVPPVNAISSTIDKAASGSLVSAAAQLAANSPAAAAVQAGAGIVQNAAGTLTAAVGSTALSPTQLEKAGILKPGAATVVNGLVQGGANLSSAMTSNLFTGKDGAGSLPSLVNNVQAQANATVAVLQQSQTALTTAGAMTGKEGAGAVAGMVLSGATQGVSATLDAVKNAGASALGAVTGAASGVLGSVQSGVNKALGAGNFAAGLAQTGLNGLAGIGSAVSASFAGLADAAKGVAASAFNAIKNSFKPFEAGVPQDLAAIAAKNAAEQVAGAAAKAAGGLAGGLANVAGGVAGGLAGAAGSLASGVAGVAGGLAGAAGGIAGGLTGAINQVAQVGATALSGAVGQVTGAAGGLTAGLNALASTNTSALVAGVNTAGQTIASLGSSALGGITGQVTGAAGALGKGFTALTTNVGSASSIASGLSSLPGGQNAVAAVSNIGAGANALLAQGTGAVAGLVGNATTAATNAISTAQAALSKLPSGGDLAAQVGGGLESLQSQAQNALSSALAQGQGLAALAGAGLPPAAASALQSAMGAISSVGETQISLPEVGLNTTDRSAIAGQTKAVLGNPKIPTPNYSGEVSTAAKATVQKQQDEVTVNLKLIEQLKKDLEVAAADARRKGAIYWEKRHSLPQGDPEIAKAEKEWEDARYKANSISQEIREAYDPTGLA